MFGIVSQSGNTPTMYNPIACFDASDTAASNIVESAGSISSMKDRAGRGNNAGQGSGSVQPLTNSSTIGGLNAAYFNNGDYLDLGDIAHSGSLTIIAAFKPISNSSGFASLFSADGANDFQIDAGPSGQWMGRFNSTNLGSGSGIGIGGNYLGDAIVTTNRLSAIDGTIKNRLNGAHINSDTYNGALSSPARMRIGANRAVNTGIVMKVGEFLIFDSALTDAQMLTIETYLMNKWGI